MIGMKVFITALFAINFISPIEVIISEYDTMKKVATWIVIALYAVGIVFTWII